MKNQAYLKALTSIESTILFKLNLNVPKDRGDVPHGGSGVDPFQALLHAVGGHVGADEHAHHVRLQQYDRSSDIKAKNQISQTIFFLHLNWFFGSVTLWVHFGVTGPTFDMVSTLAAYLCLNIFQMLDKTLRDAFEPFRAD